MNSIMLQFANRSEYKQRYPSPNYHRIDIYYLSADSQVVQTYALVVDERPTNVRNVPQLHCHVFHVGCVRSSSTKAHCVWRDIQMRMRQQNLSTNCSSSWRTQSNGIDAIDDDDNINNKNRFVHSHLNRMHVCAPIGPSSHPNVISTNILTECPWAQLMRFLMPQRNNQMHFVQIIIASCQP